MHAKKLLRKLPQALPQVPILLTDQLLVVFEVEQRVHGMMMLQALQRADHDAVRNVLKKNATIATVYWTASRCLSNKAGDRMHVSSVFLPATDKRSQEIDLYLNPYLAHVIFCGPLETRFGRPTNPST